MAVIACPNCRKKISDKAKECQHCGTSMSSLDADEIQTLKTANKLKKSQQLMNHSFIAMLLFCGGFLFLYWNNAQPDSWEYMASTVSTVLGFVIYIITRVRLILLKRN